MAIVLFVRHGARALNIILQWAHEEPIFEFQNRFHQGILNTPDLDQICPLTP